MKKSVLCLAVMFAAAAFSLATVGPAQVALAQQGKGQGKTGKQAPPSSGDGQIHILKVQGNVYMLVGPPAGNIALQVGDSGVLLVDTMTSDVSDKVVSGKRSGRSVTSQFATSSTPLSIATIREATKTSPSSGPPVVGGNLGNANRGAAIISAENLLSRMSALTPPVPDDALPKVTYFEGQKELFFNNEGIQVMLSSEGAYGRRYSIVYFRRSDVVVAGDIFLTTTYPCDQSRGGRERERSGSRG